MKCSTQEKTLATPVQGWLVGMMTEKVLVDSLYAWMHSKHVIWRMKTINRSLPHRVTGTNIRSAAWASRGGSCALATKDVEVARRVKRALEWIPNLNRLRATERKNRRTRRAAPGLDVRLALVAANVRRGGVIV